MAVRREGRWLRSFEVDIVEIIVGGREDNWKVWYVVVGRLKVERLKGWRVESLKGYKKERRKEECRRGKKEKCLRQCLGRGWCFRC